MDEYFGSISEDELKLQLNVYKSKIFKKNSKFIIYFLNKLKFLGLFQTINIYLHDHKKNYLYSIVKGITETKDANADISMHSRSLYFIFKNEFGFDTLTVNGCFESSDHGFSKSAKTLSIGSLNTLGFSLTLGLLFNPNLIFLFFSNLKKIMKNIDD